MSEGWPGFRPAVPRYRHRYPRWGLRPRVRPCGRLAPDPHGPGRMLLPGRRPRLFFVGRNGAAADGLGGPRGRKRGHL